MNSNSLGIRPETQIGAYFDTDVIRICLELFHRNYKLSAKTPDLRASTLQDDADGMDKTFFSLAELASKIGAVSLERLETGKLYDQLKLSVSRHPNVDWKPAFTFASDKHLVDDAFFPGLRMAEPGRQVDPATQRQAR